MKETINYFDLLRLIDSTHVTKLKKISTQANAYQDLYTSDGTESIKVVDVSKIIGLNPLRGEPGATWWEIITLSKGNLSEERLEDFITSNNLLNIDQKDINDIFTHESFAQCSDKLRLGYYEDEDVYFVSSGNHRVSIAKLFNVPYIRTLVSVNRKK